MTQHQARLLQRLAALWRPDFTAPELVQLQRALTDTQREDDDAQGHPANNTGHYPRHGAR